MSPPPPQSLQLAAAAHEPAAPMTDASFGTASVGGWSAQQLAQIEQHLFPIVGPIARVLVRRAAARTPGRQELYRLLADSLRTAEERRRFALAVAAGAGRVTLPEPGGGGAVVPVSVRPGPLTPATLQRASQLLARYMGPIAPLLCRRAAQTAADEAQLYSILAQRLTEPAERECFLKEATRQS